MITEGIGTPATGKKRPLDPTKPMVTLKTAWNNVRTRAKVSGRWHDNRHTLITDLAESGAGDETIRDIAGHVSKQMLKHYSHIRMEAKRMALQSIVAKKAESEAGREKGGSPIRGRRRAGQLSRPFGHQQCRVGSGQPTETYQADQDYRR